MRCLYCGKQLPLLKKLTGGGEFCSEAHRQKYQEEYNKLALSRLLQTQNADSEAPHRGELILASRHPALAGRPPLRALEAPKSADSPLAGNWTPGVNRTQRALPPPSIPTVQPPAITGKDDVTGPSVAVNEPAAKPLGRLPLPALPAPQAKQESKPEPSFRFDQKPEPKQDLGRYDQAVRPESSRLDSKSNSKRDAFSFRPIDPFPQEKLAPPPPSPPVEGAAPVAAIPLPAPVAALKAPLPAPAAKVPQPAAPAEGLFIVEQVRRAEPPIQTQLQPLGTDPFTDGRPPKPDGWQRWEPEVQAPPGGLDEPDHLFPLPGPPGTASGSHPVSQREELEQEREEIRKKILENQVKPGDFKQTVPTAPIGPKTVLPICPPAAALERVPITVRAKAPSTAPSLYLAPAANGEDMWLGWRISGTAPLRAGLTIVAPEVTETIDTVPSRMTAPAEVTSKMATPAVSLKPVSPAVKPPLVDTPRNYKAAEVLKAAAHSIVIESAPKVEVRQPDKPSTARHEVFVDLSVLGIEEDEDADAEFSAREGESPPGRLRKRRRNSAARSAVVDFVGVTLRPSTPLPATLVYSYEPVAWTDPAIPPLRLSTLPLRPRVVFEKKQAQPAVAEKQTSSLASAWSAKRLKKVEVEKGMPPQAPGDSGALAAVETSVSEPIASPKPAQVAPQDLQQAQVAPPPPEVATPAAKLEHPEQETALRDQSQNAAPVVDQGPVVEQSLTGKAAEEPTVARVLLSKPATMGPATNASSSKAVAGEPRLSARVEALKKSAREEPRSKSERKSKSGSKSEAKIERKKAAEDARADDKTADVPTLPAPQALAEKPPFEAPMLGVGATKNGSFWANLPVLPKITIALVLIGALAGGAWVALKPRILPAQTDSVKKGPLKTGPSLLMNLPGGWSPDWGGDYNRKRNRTISIYRPSLNNDDYRMEFEGQVDSKAIGWVYRAVDPKSYYASKIELVRSGPNPGAAFTRFTVVNGVESQKHYVALSKPVRAGASFRVRLDVRGDEFSAYINDELIEVWQDDRLAKGGFGLLTEVGEIGQIRKLQVYELLP